METKNGYLVWQYIIIHHSETDDGNACEWEGIRKYHKGVMGMLDIAYHFGIENINGKEVYRIGRPLTIQGGHTVGMNEVAIGICIVGNFDNQVPTTEQYQKTATLCKILMEMFDIPKDNIKPHNLYAKTGKTCPGKMFKMEEVLKYI